MKFNLIFLLLVIFSELNMLGADNQFIYPDTVDLGEIYYFSDKSHSITRYIRIDNNSNEDYYNYETNYLYDSLSFTLASYAMTNNFYNSRSSVLIQKNQTQLIQFSLHININEQVPINNLEYKIKVGFVGSESQQIIRDTIIIKAKLVHSDSCKLWQKSEVKLSNFCLIKNINYSKYTDISIRNNTNTDIEVDDIELNTDILEIKKSEITIQGGNKSLPFNFPPDTTLNIRVELDSTFDNLITLNSKVKYKLKGQDIILDGTTLINNNIRDLGSYLDYYDDTIKTDLNQSVTDIKVYHRFCLENERLDSVTYSGPWKKYEFEFIPKFEIPNSSIPNHSEIGVIKFTGLEYGYKEGFIVLNYSNDSGKISRIPLYIQTSCENTKSITDTKEEIKVLVFPNPASDLLYFNFEFLESTFNIYNQIGMEVDNGLLNKNYIDIQKLPTGSYYLIITKNNQIYKQLFIKN